MDVWINSLFIWPCKVIVSSKLKNSISFYKTKVNKNILLWSCCYFNCVGFSCSVAIKRAVTGFFYYLLLLFFLSQSRNGLQFVLRSRSEIVFAPPEISVGCLSQQIMRTVSWNLNTGLKARKQSLYQKLSAFQSPPHHDCPRTRVSILHLGPRCLI